MLVFCCLSIRSVPIVSRRDRSSKRIAVRADRSDRDFVERRDCLGRCHGSKERQTNGHNGSLVDRNTPLRQHRLGL